MNTTPHLTNSESTLVTALLNAASYPREAASTVELHETHISQVFLIGEHAYKIKKPVSNEFLDYSTLTKREHYCQEELRLDRRYAPDLYLGVVPITVDGEKIEVEGRGTVIEYAVKMRRFDQGCLLSQRLAKHTVSAAEIKQLAVDLAAFHQHAPIADSDSVFGSPRQVGRDALENLKALRTFGPSLVSHEHIDRLDTWTRKEIPRLHQAFAERYESGCIRECHGDLHAGNVVLCGNRWVPFDGIEFNSALRWIDTTSDWAFLAMDLAARDHSELGNLLVSTYIEATGDFQALHVLKWYQLYRAVVRAKVACLRLQQLHPEDESYAKTLRKVERFVHQAESYTLPRPLTLWITHGLSGSGKSTGAEAYVQEQGAIRIRSDVERKRMHGLRPESRPQGSQASEVYSSESTNDTYCRLRALARETLRSGFSAIVDATFLLQEYRDAFAELASDLGVEFEILNFEAPESLLRARVAERASADSGASDAGLKVLEQQIEHHDPLTAHERQRARSMRTWR